MATTKIIYVAGAGRSGTTLLDNILGQVDGFFSGGELAYIWKRGFIQNRLCGCGKPFASCDLWRSVVSAAMGEVPLDRAELLASQVPRSRSMMGMLCPGGTRRIRREYGELLDALEYLYPSIAAVTGSELVVDSSKVPAYAYLLTFIPSLEIHVVHMVRDPRAVAYSWSRKKLSLAKGPDQYMKAHGPFNSAVFWDLWNLESEALRSRSIASYTQLRYEDFVATPSETLNVIAGAVGIDPCALPPISNGCVTIRPTHTVSGNPSRFQTGAIELKLDAEWTAEMRTRNRLIVNALTGPLMGRYGYRILRRA